MNHKLFRQASVRLPFFLSDGRNVPFFFMVTTGKSPSRDARQATLSLHAKPHSPRLFSRKAPFLRRVRGRSMAALTEIPQLSKHFGILSLVFDFIEQKQKIIALTYFI
ncbi:hypothetical protein [uncultured Mailhella sp.]|uniref:hypothetical protein n=1 Tax=uncultured Mailhella sp. TaxID=1981031 RepID=UPI0025EE6C44|nr:hypothetical protein [uncultured Mailhella sp.]